MTPQSIAIALAATLLTGLLGGWLFRERTTGRNWSFAVSAAIGLLLFRASSVDDLFRDLVPTSAVGWLPWVCLSVAGLWAMTHEKLRVTSAFVLGLVIPLRLLWGSVYLSEPNLSLTVLVAFAAWSLAIGTAIAMRKPAPKERFSVHVFGWALLIGSSVCVIATTGSITYAVATGVVGIAVVANLFGASRLPLQGAAVLICLIGLSVAFSEMPLSLGTLLIASAMAISYVSQEGILSMKWSKSIRIAAHATLVCVAAFAISKLFASSSEHGGYEASASQIVDEVDSTPKSLFEAIGSSIAPVAKDVIDPEPMPDPFAGFDP